jgi:uncharacterized damage-inducible protein DinB
MEDITQKSASQLTNREFLITRRAQEHQAFVDVCRAIPADSLAYRPHPHSRSAGELIALFVSSEKTCAELCETGKSSYASGLRWHERASMASLDELIGNYEEQYHSLQTRLTHLDDTTWSRPAWLVGEGREILLKDTVGGLLWLALFDAVHHRGQLSVYIRPAGGVVPSIYGPSGDTPSRR